MSTSERINGFDALRTVAMWLGIVLHSIIVFKVVPENNWPHDPTLNSCFFDWLYDYIHIFRMPLFFMVAGFFSRMVIIRSGIYYFIRQRFKRIFIPFIAGLIFIAPITLFPFHFYTYFNLDRLPLSVSWKKSFGDIFIWSGMAHLWFLYYLIIFYILSILLVWCFKKGGLTVTDEIKKIIGKASVMWILPGILVFFLILYILKSTEPVIYTGIYPRLSFILYYGFFYYIGWILQINIKSLGLLSSFCWQLFLIGSALSVFQFLYPISNPTGGLLLAAIQTICLVSGISGLFIKYFHAENKTWRYFSDAAYWVYLVHMVAVATLQVLLINSSCPGWLRLPCILTGTFLFSLITYQQFVRYTFLGDYLHGHREKNPKPRMA